MAKNKFYEVTSSDYNMQNQKYKKTFDNRKEAEIYSKNESKKDVRGFYSIKEISVDDTFYHKGEKK